MTTGVRTGDLSGVCENIYLSHGSGWSRVRNRKTENFNTTDVVHASRSPGFPRFLPHVSETYPIIEYSVSGVQCRRCDDFDKDFSVFDGRPGQLAGSRAEQSFKCHGGNDLRATSMAIQRFSSTSHDAQ